MVERTINITVTSTGIDTAAKDIKTLSGSLGTLETKAATIKKIMDELVTRSAALPGSLQSTINTVSGNLEQTRSKQSELFSAYQRGGSPSQPPPATATYVHTNPEDKKQLEIIERYKRNATANRLIELDALKRYQSDSGSVRHREFIRKRWISAHIRPEDILPEEGSTPQSKPFGEVSISASELQRQAGQIRIQRDAELKKAVEKKAGRPSTRAKKETVVVKKSKYGPTPYEEEAVSDITDVSSDLAKAIEEGDIKLVPTQSETPERTQTQVRLDRGEKILGRKRNKAALIKQLLAVVDRQDRAVDALVEQETGTKTPVTDEAKRLIGEINKGGAKVVTAQDILDEKYLGAYQKNVEVPRGRPAAEIKDTALPSDIGDIDVGGLAGATAKSVSNAIQTGEQIILNNIRGTPPSKPDMGTSRLGPARQKAIQYPLAKITGGYMDVSRIVSTIPTKVIKSMVKAIETIPKELLERGTKPFGVDVSSIYEGEEGKMYIPSEVARGEEEVNPTAIKHEWVHTQGFDYAFAGLARGKSQSGKTALNSFIRKFASDKDKRFNQAITYIADRYSRIAGKSETDVMADIGAMLGESYDKDYAIWVKKFNKSLKTLIPEGNFKESTLVELRPLFDMFKQGAGLQSALAYLPYKKQKGLTVSEVTSSKLAEEAKKTFSFHRGEGVSNLMARGAAYSYGEPDTHLLLATTKNSIVGALSYSINKQIGELAIKNVGVPKGGRGTGTALVKAVKWIADTVKASRVVVPEALPAAQKWWYDRGFRFTDPRDTEAYERGDINWAAEMELTNRLAMLPPKVTVTGDELQKAAEAASTPVVKSGKTTKKGKGGGKGKTTKVTSLQAAAKELDTNAEANKLDIRIVEPTEQEGVVVVELPTPAPITQSETIKKAVEKVKGGTVQSGQRSAHSLDPWKAFIRDEYLENQKLPGEDVFETIKSRGYTGKKSAISSYIKELQSGKGGILEEMPSPIEGDVGTTIADFAVREFKDVLGSRISKIVGNMEKILGDRFLVRFRMGVGEEGETTGRINVRVRADPYRIKEMEEHISAAAKRAAAAERINIPEEGAASIVAGNLYKITPPDPVKEAKKAATEADRKATDKMRMEEFLTKMNIASELRTPIDANEELRRLSTSPILEKFFNTFIDEKGGEPEKQTGTAGGIGKVIDQLVSKSGALGRVSWQFTSLAMSALGVYFSLLGIVTMIQRGLNSIFAPLTNVQGLLQAIGMSKSFTPELGLDEFLKGLLGTSNYTDKLVEGWKKMTGLASTFTAMLGGFGAKVLTDPATWEHIVNIIKQIQTFLKDDELFRLVQEIFASLDENMTTILAAFKTLASLIKDVLLPHANLFAKAWAVSLVVMPVASLLSALGNVAKLIGSITAGVIFLGTKLGGIKLGGLAAEGLAVGEAGMLAAGGAETGAAIAPVAAAGTSLASLLPIIAGVAIAIGLLYTIWSKNIGGIQEKTKEVFAAVGKAFGRLTESFSKLFTGSGALATSLANLAVQLAYITGLDTKISAIFDLLIILVNTATIAVNKLSNELRTLAEWINKIPGVNIDIPERDKNPITTRIIRYQEEIIAEQTKTPTKRAEGGPLKKGELALVGEQGPELIIPKTEVDVISNKQTEKLAANLGIRKLAGGTINVDTESKKYPLIIYNTDPKLTEKSVMAALNEAGIPKNVRVIYEDAIKNKENLHKSNMYGSDVMLGREPHSIVISPQSDVPDVTYGGMAFLPNKNTPNYVPNKDASKGMVVSDTTLNSRDLGNRILHEGAHTYGLKADDMVKDVKFSELLAKVTPVPTLVGKDDVTTHSKYLRYLYDGTIATEDNTEAVKESTKKTGGLIDRITGFVSSIGSTLGLKQQAAAESTLGWNEASKYSGAMNAVAVNGGPTPEAMNKARAMFVLNDKGQLIRSLPATTKLEDKWLNPTEEFNPDKFNVEAPAPEEKAEEVGVTEDSMPFLTPLVANLVGRTASKYGDRILSRITTRISSTRLGKLAGVTPRTAGQQTLKGAGIGTKAMEALGPVFSGIAKANPYVSAMLFAKDIGIGREVGGPTNAEMFGEEGKSVADTVDLTGLGKPTKKKGWLERTFGPTGPLAALQTGGTQAATVGEGEVAVAGIDMGNQIAKEGITASKITGREQREEVKKSNQLLAGILGAINVKSAFGVGSGAGVGGISFNNTATIGGGGGPSTWKSTGGQGSTFTGPGGVSGGTGGGGGGGSGSGGDTTPPPEETAAEGRGAWADQSNAADNSTHNNGEWKNYGTTTNPVWYYKDLRGVTFGPWNKQKTDSELVAMGAITSTVVNDVYTTEEQIQDQAQWSEDKADKYAVVTNEEYNAGIAEQGPEAVRVSVEGGGTPSWQDQERTPTEYTYADNIEKWANNKGYIKYEGLKELFSYELPWGALKSGHESNKAFHQDMLPGLMSRLESLDIGGLITQTGLAQVHAGEIVAPQNKLIEMIMYFFQMLMGGGGNWNVSTPSMAQKTYSGILSSLRGGVIGGTTFIGKQTTPATAARLTPSTLVNASTGSTIAPTTTTDDGKIVMGSGEVVGAGEMSVTAPYADKQMVDPATLSAYHPTWDPIGSFQGKAVDFNTWMADRENFDKYPVGTPVYSGNYPGRINLVIKQLQTDGSYKAGLGPAEEGGEYYTHGPYKGRESAFYNEWLAEYNSMPKVVNGYDRAVYLADIQNIQLATGGLVSQTGTALLHAGEIVASKSSLIEMILAFFKKLMGMGSNKWTTPSTTYNGPIRGAVHPTPSLGEYTGESTSTLIPAQDEYMKESEYVLKGMAGGPGPGSRTTSELLRELRNKRPITQEEYDAQVSYWKRQGLTENIPTLEEINNKIKSNQIGPLLPGLNVYQLGDPQKYFDQWKQIYGSSASGINTLDDLKKVNPELWADMYYMGQTSGSPTSGDLGINTRQYNTAFEGGSGLPGLYTSIKQAAVGGLMSKDGLINAHAGEIISPVSKITDLIGSVSTQRGREIESDAKSVGDVNITININGNADRDVTDDMVRKLKKELFGRGIY